MASTQSTGLFLSLTKQLLLSEQVEPCCSGLSLYYLCVLLTKTTKPHMVNKVVYIKASRTSTMQQ